MMDTLEELPAESQGCTSAASPRDDLPACSAIEYEEARKGLEDSGISEASDDPFEDIEEPRRTKPARHEREKWVDNPIFRIDRQDFRIPLKFQKPHPYDLVITHAAVLLEEYNKHSYERTVDPLVMEALSASPTMFYAGGCDSTAAVHCLVRGSLFVKIQLKYVYPWL